MTVIDPDPPRAYTLRFEGQGGVAGFARGEAAIALSPEGQSTRLAYTAKATVGGKLAQVGARLIDGVAKQLAGKFFDNFNKRASAKP
jgi:carbon monoxide dehydrogenase subunit G